MRATRSSPLEVLIKSRKGESRSPLPIPLVPKPCGWRLLQVIGQIILAAESTCGILLALDLLKVRSSGSLASQTLAVLDQLDVAKTSRHTTVAVGVESVKNSR